MLKYKLIQQSNNMMTENLDKNMQDVSNNFIPVEMLGTSGGVTVSKLD